MKLTLLPADKGDCFLVTGAKRDHILVDGGLRESYKERVRPELAKLVHAGEELVVCVSHIDSDHIAGIVQLLDDEVAWRVHEFQVAGGNTRHRKPAFPRPPKVREIWHNGFSEQVGAQPEHAASMLENVAVAYAGGDGPSLELARLHRDLATGVADGIRLGRRIGPRQLGIDHQPKEFRDRPMVVGSGKPPRFELVGMQVTLIAPFQEDLAKLRNEWRTWVQKNQRALDEIRRRGAEEERRLRGNEIARVLGFAAAEAEIMGDRAGVTISNLASLMLLVEEDGKTALLTGDGHTREALRGLKQAGALVGGTAHVNLLKIPHHGARNNVDPEFCRAVIADHYAFCADGAHENPDLKVVEAVIDSRLSDRKRSEHPLAERPFTLWFNESSATAGHEARREHLRRVERLVRQRSHRRMRVVFRKRPSGGLEVAL